MTQQKIIVRGKLDYAEGSYLIRPVGATKKYLSAYIHPHIGKRIIISLEEPEEQQDPIVNEAFVGVLQQA